MHATEHSATVIYAVENKGLGKSMGSIPSTFILWYCNVFWATICLCTLESQVYKSPIIRNGLAFKFIQPKMLGICVYCTRIHFRMFIRTTTETRVQSREQKKKYIRLKVNCADDDNHRSRVLRVHCPAVLHHSHGSSLLRCRSTLSEAAINSKCDKRFIL